MSLKQITSPSSYGQILCLMPLLCLALMIGCSEVDRAAVSGRITLDGMPVDGGTISFIPNDNKPEALAWTEIKQGNYTIPTDRGPSVGSCRVEIHWIKETGMRLRPNVMPHEKVREMVPKRYNSQSVLKAEITPGENEVNFELKSN